MRELKFRAWNDRLKKMSYPDSNGFYNRAFLGENGVYQSTMSLRVLFDHDVPVMQFAGYADCKGVDYYEGDLISNNIRTDKETIREVRFSGGCWMLVRVKGNSSLPKEILLSEFSALNFPIVGNIYENPELLDKPKN